MLASKSRTKLNHTFPWITWSASWRHVRPSASSCHVADCWPRQRVGVQSQALSLWLLVDKVNVWQLYLRVLRLFIRTLHHITVDSVDPRLWDVGLQSIECRNRSFESRWGHDCSSILFVLYCVGTGLCDELVTRSEDCCRVCVCVCVWMCACELSRNINNEVV